LTFDYRQMFLPGTVYDLVHQVRTGGGGSAGWKHHHQRQRSGAAVPLSAWAPPRGRGGAGSQLASPPSSVP